MNSGNCKSNIPVYRAVTEQSFLLQQGLISAATKDETLADYLLVAMGHQPLRGVWIRVQFKHTANTAEMQILITFNAI
jgi:hypothetical protein